MKRPQPSLLTTPTFPIGASVRLLTAPGNLSRYAGLTGEVVSVESGGVVAVAAVRFADGSDVGIHVKDIPCVYLTPTEAGNGKRRSPLRLVPDSDNRTEREKQDEGQNWLQDHGYKVLVAGQYMHRTQCRNCGEWGFPKGGQGSTSNSPGYPDLAISHPERWKHPATERIPSCLIEYKKSATEPKRTDEQIKLADSGQSAFVWSLAMLLLDVYRFEAAWIPAGPHPAIREWLEGRGLIPALEGAKE